MNLSTNLVYKGRMLVPASARYQQDTKCLLRIGQMTQLIQLIMMFTSQVFPDELVDFIQKLSTPICTDQTCYFIQATYISIFIYLT